MSRIRKHALPAGRPEVVTRKEILAQADTYAKQMGTTRQQAFKRLDAGEQMPSTLAGARLEGVYSALRASNRR